MSLSTGCSSYLLSTGAHTVSLPSPSTSLSLVGRDRGRRGRARDERRREAAAKSSSPGVAAAAASASEESALVPGCLHFSALAIRVSRGGERTRLRRLPGQAVNVVILIGNKQRLVPSPLCGRQQPTLGTTQFNGDSSRLLCAASAFRHILDLRRERMREPLPAALHQRAGKIPGFIYTHARQCVAEGGVCTLAGGGGRRR